MHRIKIAVAIATLLPAAAVAQDRGNVEQIGSQQHAPLEQVSSGSRQLDTPRRTEGRVAPQPQLSSGDESIPAAEQLIDEGQSRRAPTQLYRGGPTAQASEALSRPSEGRTGAMAAIGGRDRCDVAEGNREAQTRACAHVIETRSAEYARPNPNVLSPEQRLLVDQRLREGATTPRAAARRLAENGEDAQSPESQGIASLVLNRPPARRDEKPREEVPGLSAEAAAIISAIIAMPIAGTTPN